MRKNQTTPLAATAVAAVVAGPASAAIVVVGDPGGPPLLSLADTTSAPLQIVDLDLDSDGLDDIRFIHDGGADFGGFGEGSVSAPPLDTQNNGRSVQIASTTPPPPDSSPGAASSLALGSMVDATTPFLDSADGTPATPVSSFGFYGLGLFDAFFATPPSGEFDPSGGPFTGYFGFAFETGGTVVPGATPDYVGGQTLYGYGQVTINNDAFYTYTVDYLAYETTGAGIEVGAVPEPASAVLIAGAACGLFARRRR